MSDPPTNIEAEEAVLGALMVSPATLRPVIIESGIRSAHFYRDRHRLIFDAVCALAERRQPVDALSVLAELDGRTQQAGGKAYVSSLASNVPVAGNAGHYAKLVVEQAALRAKLEGAHAVIQGVQGRDQQAIQSGIEQLTQDIVASAEPSEPHEVRNELLEYLDAPGEPEVFTLPWAPLNDHVGAGGYLRGEFSLLVGWTNLGKSLVLDQMLSGWADQGYNCHLFTTEMSRLERAMRYAAAKTGIPYGKMIRRKLTPDERARVGEHTDPFPFGIRTAQGWTVDRIVQEIASRECDIAAIDPINLIRFDRTSGQTRTAWMDDVLERLASIAIGADCHVLGVSQLNMARARDENPPPPALRDIRESGTAQYIAHHILALHREHRSGEPTKNGELRFLKVRNGVRGGCDVTFKPKTLSFEVKSDEPTQEILEYRSQATDDPVAVDPFDE